MERTKHLFAGSNTAEGFYGYYPQLMQSAKRTVIIKGGPGVGKSTLMKKVGGHYEKEGLEVHYFHCSGDPDSMDAVYVPEKGYLMVDGTAPHVLDPVCPGAADGILNLGVCLNEKLLSEQHEEVAGVFAEVSRTYARAYRCLKAAAVMRQDADAVYRCALEADKRRQLVNELLALVPDGEEGKESHGFLQAITWQGVVQYPSWLDSRVMVSLQLPFGMDADDFLRPLLHLARQRKLEIRCWYDPLEGRKLTHLQAGDTLFTTACPKGSRILSPEMKQEEIIRFSSRLSFDRAVHDLCLHQAVEVLAEAKAGHDRLERYYIDAMDFGRLQAITQEVLEELP